MKLGVTLRAVDYFGVDGWTAHATQAAAGKGTIATWRELIVRVWSVRGARQVQTACHFMLPAHPTTLKLLH